MSGVAWGPVIGGLVLLAVGGSAYAGVAKPFWAGLWPRATLGFGLLWLGLAGVLVGLGWPVLDTAPGALLLGLPATACFVVGIMSFAWMPRALQAPWFREWSKEDRGAR